ncbi:hypothetical protein [Flavobacterium sp. DG2-3]|uniref:hypothetical protein n=1 Tax=Flavobacterium sp. DG2-3 TaxID=3068317 RepID=UPI00273CFF08|nr:hypothetical protein [Flavobacterium sp. DG2-3]MDP5199120.1 hypothetical protein [Flavobacterium sp. DG2-3]
MTANHQNIGTQLIGESFPYLFENADKIVFNEGTTEIPLFKSFQSYEKENFIELLKTLSTLSSLSLARELKTNKKNYFLAEKARIRKVSFTPPSGLLRAKIRSYLENNQKGKSLIEVVDDKTTVYHMEIDYFIIDEPSFQKIFELNYSAEKANGYTDTEPNVSIEPVSKDEFNITVDKFTRNHCAGHFDHYEIVAATHIGRSILKVIFEMTPDLNMEIDNMEIALSKAMPIDTVFKVNVKILHLSKTLKKYICAVTDDKTLYGYYFCTFKIIP